MIDQSSTPASILIVDDNPNNLRVLGGMLQQSGYKVRPALSGALALRSMQSSLPDLVLLDIRMPEMDGYEVCRRLKLDPVTRKIPVIFISALQEAGDKVDAFSAGGVDYIVKPFQIEEVLARVQTHTELSSTRRQLEASKDLLEQQVEARTHELRESRDQLQQDMRYEQLLTELLNVSLRPAPMDDYLDKCLRVLGGSLNLQSQASRSAIMLWDDEGACLRLNKSLAMSNEQCESCARVLPGQCGCGQAIQCLDLVHCNAKNPCIEVRFGGTEDAGRCSVPLIYAGKPLGVLVYYHPYEQELDEQQRSFLLRAADVLSMGISRRQADERIEYLAYHDELTSLPNRRVFEDRLSQELRRAGRRREIGAVLFLDLDRFKNINDVLGHSVGDKFLVRISERLCGLLRAEDSLCRWGGDEFLILLPVLAQDMQTGVSRANMVGEKIIQAVSEPVQVGGNDLQLTASIGIAMFPEHTPDCENLIKYADTAMYQAKNEGRNRISFYESVMHETVERRLRMERDLRQALKNREIFTVYQPQVLADGECIGMEVLARWEHPEQGLVMPGEFIGLAEDSGQIVSIGEWVLTDALARLRDWRQSFPTAHRLKTLSVNVSSRQFHERDFAERVERMIRQSGVEPECMELEVTESMLLENFEDTVAKMYRLRDFGVSFAIDDFGTGYSSLAYLKRLPVSRLKIDQSFVRDVHKDPQDAAIANTIINMAHNLNLEVIAEGTETLDEVSFLSAAGCEVFQGYYFSRPMRPADMSELWSRERLNLLD